MSSPARVLYLFAVTVLACEPEKGLDAPAPPRSLVAPAIAECPIDDPASRPGEILVRVENLDGIPVPDALVVVGGRGARTNQAGDAQFDELVPREYVVSVRVANMRAISRRVVLSEGEQVRLELTAEPVLATSSVEVDLEHGESAEGVSIILSANSLGDIDGVAPTDDPVLEWSWSTVEGSDSLTDSAPAVREDGTRIMLNVLAGVEVNAHEEDGAPLFLQDGAFFTYVGQFDVLSAGSDCESVGAWLFDPWTGLYVQQSEVEPSLVTDDVKTLLAAGLPELGRWALGTSAAVGCVNVQVEACDGAEAMPLDVELTVGGRVERRAFSAANSTLVFDDIAEGESAEFTLLSGDVELSAEVVDVTGAAACDAVTLELPDCSGLALDLRTMDSCPARDGTVTATSSDGLTIYSAPLAGMVQLPDLAAGAWSWAVRSGTGTTLASGTATVADDALTFQAISMFGAAASTPPGGCAPPPCRGPDCDACVVLTAYDDSGAPQPDVDVSVYDPVADVFTTDSDGQICVDVTDGVGAAPIYYNSDFGVGSAALEWEGSCTDESSCVARTFWAGETCPDDTTGLDLVAARLGWTIPGWLDEAPDLDDWSLDTTSLSLELSADSLSVEGLASVTCDGSVWASVGLWTDPVGLIHEDVTRVQCTGESGDILRVYFDWPDDALVPGMISVGSDGVGMQMGWESASGDETGWWQATGGSLILGQRGPDRIVAALDLQLASTDGEVAEVTGSLDGRLVSAADAPRAASELSSHGLNGAYIVSEAPDADFEWTFGPTSAGGPSEEYGDGTIDPTESSPGLVSTEVCLIEDHPTLLRAFGPSKLLKASSPLLQARETDVRMYRNAAGGPLIPDTLYLLERSVAETIYRNNGRAVSDIDVGATILGRPARFDSSTGELVRLNGFMTVLLRAPDGRSWRAVPLDDELKPTEPTTASLYVFMGIPPAAVDNPYVLTLRGLSGVVVAEYSQRLVPEAGTATVIAWDASAP